MMDPAPPAQSPVDDSGDLADSLQGLLDVSDLKPDREIGEDDQSVASSTSTEDQHSSTNGHVQANGDSQTDTKHKKTKDGGGETSNKKSGGFSLFKRLSSKSKKDKPASLDSLVKNVTVDSLPLKFVTKFLGAKKCEGLWGIHNVRPPLEEMISDLQARPKDQNLPLINLVVSKNGLQISEHKTNKCNEHALKGVTNIPIEFISYGVQDIRYTRIFSFIIVREMSSRNRLTECHAYICDSVITARKMALAISKAFHEYSNELQGKPFRFQVDLRSTKELEEDLSKEAPAEEEC